MGSTAVDGEYDVAVKGPFLLRNNCGDRQNYQELTNDPVLGVRVVGK